MDGRNEGGRGKEGGRVEINKKRLRRKKRRNISSKRKDKKIIGKGKKRGELPKKGKILILNYRRKNGIKNARGGQTEKKINNTHILIKDSTRMRG